MMFKGTTPFLVNWCFSLSAWQTVLETRSRKRLWREDESSRDSRLLETLKEEREKSNSKTIYQGQKTTCIAEICCFVSQFQSQEKQKKRHVIQGQRRSILTKSQQSIRHYEKQKGKWKDKLCQEQEPSSSSSWAPPVKWAGLGQSWRKIPAQDKYTGQGLIFIFTILWKAQMHVICFKNTLAEQQKHSFRQKG